MNEKVYCVYIMTNKRNGTLYVGMSNDLARRCYEHKNELTDGFTKKYHLHRLVYYEVHDDPTEAIIREKQIKKWYRKWKIELIEGQNPEWKDLYKEIS
jgi:putative endonuclease